MIPELEDALHLDYETWSTVNLPKAGPWVYGEHWSTSVWTACFARGDGPVEAWHPGDPFPRTIERAVEDGVPFVAHNVGFERAITHTQMFTKHGWPLIPLDRWWCTASMAAAMCLPRKLEDLALLLNCIEKKDMEGHRLMLKMMKPAKRIMCHGCHGHGTIHGIECFMCEGHGEFLTWHDSPADINRGTLYCMQDVRTERALIPKLRALSPSERKIWLLDQRINERGVLVDTPTVHKALKLVKKAVADLGEETRLLTGGSKDESGNITGGVLPSQVRKLRTWLMLEGLHVEDLRKDTVSGILASPNLDAILRQALELRQEAAKTSTAKLNAYLARTCADDRMRDNLMYHGAGTGRWAGRGAQLQNLPSRYLLKKWQIEKAIECIAAGWDAASLRMWFDSSVLEIISACLRGMIIAAPGHEIICADYNAIEARVAAWLAGAAGLLGVFSRGEDPYLFMAASIYKHVNLSGVDWTQEDVVEALKALYKNERALGKIAVLGLGYQMGWEKFQLTCAKERILITDDEAKHTVMVYRDANHEIKDLWGELGEAAFEAVRRPETVVEVPLTEGKIKFVKHGTWLYMRLPSGRVLSYASPRIEKRDMPWIDQETGVAAVGWGVTFMGVNSLTHKWSKQYAYGGKWLENGDQAASRDILANALVNLEAAGYPPIVSVHDEPVSEVPEGFGSVKEYETIMCTLPAWAEGLPLKAEGWRGPRYRK
jgi:DNA polymerase bacteriophage-type